MRIRLIAARGFTWTAYIGDHAQRRCSCGGDFACECLDNGRAPGNQADAEAFASEAPRERGTQSRADTSDDRDAVHTLPATGMIFRKHRRRLHGLAKVATNPFGHHGIFLETVALGRMNGDKRGRRLSSWFVTATVKSKEPNPAFALFSEDD